jgi:sulfofructose kinase
VPGANGVLSEKFFVFIICRSILFFLSYVRIKIPESTFLSRKNPVENPTDEGTFDVVGLGCNAVDHLCLMDLFPPEDQKTQVETIEMQGGGNVATALVAVTRLGGSAAYHAVVGDDSYRQSIEAAFKREKVNIDYLITKQGNNPLALILINRSRGTRTIMYTKRGVPSFSADEVEEELIARARVLLIDFYYPEASLEAARVARSAGIPVVVDAEKPSALAPDILSLCTHVIASCGFARHYTGVGEDAASETLLRAFADRLECSFVCITLGMEGAIAWNRDETRPFLQPAYAVATVDTTGAGDVFHGAFALLLARGRPHVEAVRYAAACSAMKCRSLGGRLGIPTMEQLTRFLEERR